MATFTFSLIPPAGVADGQRAVHVPPPKDFDSLEEAQRQPVTVGFTAAIHSAEGSYAYTSGKWSQLFPRQST
jgi:hypothetical protein